MSGLSDGADVYYRIDTAETLSPALIATLDELCDRVEAAGDDAIAVLHLIGRDDAVSAWPGQDVGIHAVNRWERVLRRVERLGAVTIAVIEGSCHGPALEILLATDYRIGTRDTRLSLPLTSGEFWPGMALHRLANQVGVAQARRLVLFASELSAAQAMQLGLVDELVDDVVEGVSATTALVGRVTGAELGIRRRLLLEATTTTFEDALGTHLAACDRTLRRAAAGTASVTP